MEAFDNGDDKFSTNEIVAQYFLSDYTFYLSLFRLHFLSVAFSISHFRLPWYAKFPVSR